MRRILRGCLSVPGWQAVVARHAHVRLRGQDERGRELDEEVSGWPARIVQHETDHLDGTLYIDRAITRSLTSAQTLIDRWSQPTPPPQPTPWASTSPELAARRRGHSVVARRESHELHGPLAERALAQRRLDAVIRRPQLEVSTTAEPC